MEMTDLIRFEVLDDRIQTPQGDYYFFRMKPPNFSTLDITEKESLYLNFEKFMHSTTEIPFNIFALDRTVNLSVNREFIESLNSRFDDIKNGILSDLSAMENTMGNTQRAYYFIIHTNQRAQVENFQTCLRGAQIVCTPAGRKELIAVMRCFLRRDFIDEDIFGMEEPSFESEN